jgi:xanthine dehydrogenase iron-sulfur cluster and FAD-binding subunit A
LREKMPREASNSPGARALRQEGFVKLPGLWVTEEERDLVVFMAEKHLPEINRIKAEAERLDLLAGYGVK